MHSRKGVLDTSVASSELLRNHVRGEARGRLSDDRATEVAARTERAGY